MVRQHPRKGDAERNSPHVATSAGSVPLSCIDRQFGYKQGADFVKRVIDPAMLEVNLNPAVGRI